MFMGCLRRLNSKRFCLAFTLAEVLITLGIIGVVAALTIPALVTYNQQKGWDTSSSVFQRKLGEALGVMNTQQALAGYHTTEDFVDELQKHLKIIKVCKNDELLSCFEDTVMFGAGDTEPEEVDMTKVKTAKHFGQKEWGTNIVGIQLASGVGALIAYNPKCSANPYDANSVTISGTRENKSGTVGIATDCVAVLYDTTGTSTPNTIGKDLRGLNVTSLGQACGFKIDSSCYSTPFIPEPHVWKACDSTGVSTNVDDLAFMQKMGIKKCMSSKLGNKDYWAGAVEKCGGVDKLPDGNQLGLMADYVYNTSGIGTTVYKYDLQRDDDKARELGFTVTPGASFYVWSSYQYPTYPDSSGLISMKFFNPDSCFWANGGRTRASNYVQAVCLED